MSSIVQATLRQYYTESRDPSLQDSKRCNSSDISPLKPNPLLPYEKISVLQGPPKKSHAKLPRMICSTLHTFFGAHKEGSQTVFRVFAPNAKNVNVIIKKNGVPALDLSTYSMERTADGVWYVGIALPLEGLSYQYQITKSDGKVIYKADPFSFQFEPHIFPFRHESTLTSSPFAFTWNDDAWVKKRQAEAGKAKPFHTYEVYPAAWKKANGGYLNYREIAHKLAEHCKEMSYTHVELMGVMEHPNDGSWGYQVSGYFAPTSRHGSIEDFQYMIDYLHQNNIGVGLDFISAHFCVDDFSLSKFDGSPIFEPNSDDLAMHPVWRTYLFAFPKTLVRDFLLSSARFWVEQMHVDFLRVDAAPSFTLLEETYMGRHDWPRNHKGSHKYFEGRSFLKELNHMVHTIDPSLRVIAEDTREQVKTCAPISNRGFGFDAKWGIYWANQTLAFFHEYPVHRPYHHQEIIDSIHKALDPRIVLSLSHDDVASHHGSLMHRMQGSTHERFASLRSLATYLITLPAPKLTFMGNELGQPQAWNNPITEESQGKGNFKQCREGVQWEVLSPGAPDREYHGALHEMHKELNRLYANEPSLWADETSSYKFRWIDAADSVNSVVSFFRQAPDQRGVICVHNFGSNGYEVYDIHFRDPNHFPEGKTIKSIQALFSSNAARFKGTSLDLPSVTLLTEKENTVGFRISLPAQTSLIFSAE